MRRDPRFKEERSDNAKALTSLEGANVLELHTSLGGFPYVKDLGADVTNANAQNT